ncbi:MAG: lamin tail domain-containing protein, partial [Bacteroidota bacterium]
MKSKVLILLALFLSVLCTCGRAQTTLDDFSDGDLLNPEWLGDTEKFTVSEGRLRLLDETREDPAQLYVRTPVSAEADTLVYSFLVEMDFAPSASNFTTIRLTEGAPANGSVTSGVELKFGGVSGDQDALSATFFTDGTELGQIEGTTGALGSSPAIVRFRLRREMGIWSLDADYSGGTDYLLQGSLGATNTLAPDFFEIDCRYTSTRFDKFSFDDLSVSAAGIPVDETAPELTSATVVSATEIDLVFSEPLVNNATDANNYQLSAAGVTVASVSGNGSNYRLNLNTDLPAGEAFTLTVFSAEDAAGNTATDLTANLLYDPTVPPMSENVQITEFLPDPNPVVGLPEVEYLELHNPSDVAVELSGLGVASGGSPVTIATGRIPAGGYVVLVPASAAQAFRDLGASVVEINLPGLSNAGDEISLLFNGDILQNLNYTDDWYNDPDRDGGGYSLEFTGGADAGCNGRWRASLDPSGGTPGRENSVLGMPLDEEGPFITSISVDPDGITIVYNEAITETRPTTISLEGTTNAPGISGVTAVVPGIEFRIGFLSELPENEVFTLSVSATTDCSGNEGPSFAQAIGLPGAPEAGDVVINEILFNPGSGGSDFLELFNCSEKVFQIQGWVLENTQSTSSTSASRTISASKLFLPGDYLTITNDPEDLETRYQNVNRLLLVDQNLPSLPNDEGNISVIADGVSLDAFDYTDDLHTELLNDEDGVSLERLRAKATTQDPNNWYSAASSEGFATPTRPNSQNRDALPTGGSEVFSLLNTTFSPDGDSNEDFLE